jgi:hypothetical protein
VKHADPEARRRIEQLDAAIGDLYQARDEAEMERDRVWAMLKAVQADNAQAYEDGESSGYADWQCAFSEWTDAGDDIDTPQAAVGYVTRLEAERDEAVNRLGEYGTPAVLWRERATEAEAERDELRAKVARVEALVEVSAPLLAEAERRGAEKGWDEGYELGKQSDHDAYSPNPYSAAPSAPLTPSEPSSLPTAPNDDATGGAE